MLGADAAGQRHWWRVRSRRGLDISAETLEPLSNEERAQFLALASKTPCGYFAITGTRVAGGVLRLRCVRTMPSMMVMPTPGRSPSWMLARDPCPAECCALSRNTKSALRPFSIRPHIELAHARGVAGGEAERDLGRDLADRGEHRDHAQDPERLNAGAGRAHRCRG